MSSSPPANEGDDDMHEPRVRRPSAALQRGGAEGSRGASGGRSLRRPAGCAYLRLLLSNESQQPSETGIRLIQNVIFY